MKGLTYIFLILILSITTFANYAEASNIREKVCEDLQKKKKLNIKLKQCFNIANELGQLFVAHVDGYGSDDPISQGYLKLVKDYDVGGVIVQEGMVDDLVELKKSLERLKANQETPLITSIDFLSIPKNERKFDSIFVGIGWDSEEDILNWRKPNACIKRKAYLTALLQKMTGINTALGPVVEHKWSSDIGAGGLVDNTDQTTTEMYFDLKDAYDELGVETTIKHFPFTPETFNLHRDNKDTHIPKEKVMSMIKIFGDISSRSDIVMTTHIYNSTIDKDNIATFSETWINLLRAGGFKGLIMTDGMFMLSKQDKAKIFLSGWPHEQIKLSDFDVLFTAKAILAGHNLVLLEGSSGDLKRVFRGILEIIASNTDVGNKLINQINTSYKSIMDYKSTKGNILRQDLSYDSSVFNAALELLQDDNLCSRDEDFANLKHAVKKLQTESSIMDFDSLKSEIKDTGIIKPICSDCL